jgi:hypothetical protein
MRRTCNSIGIVININQVIIQEIEPRAVAVSGYGWLKTFYGWLAG